MLQIEAVSLDKAALQPHCTPAPTASANRPQARALQFTEGRYNLRPRKARQPIPGTKVRADMAQDCDVCTC